MKYKAICDLLALLKADVTFNSNVNKTEVDFDVGMKAKVISSELDTYGTAVLGIDATPYREYNKNHTDNNYYDKDGQPTLTVFEADCYSDKDRIFLIDDDGILVTPEDPKLQKIIEYVEAHNLDDITLPDLLLHLSTRGEYPLDNAGVKLQDQLLKDGDVLVSGSTIYDTYSGEELPPFVLGVFKYDKEDELELFSGQERFDTWNSSINALYTDENYPSSGLINTINGKKALEKDNNGFMLDGDNIYGKNLQKLSEETVSQILRYQTLENLAQDAVNNVDYLPSPSGPAFR